MSPTLLVGLLLALLSAVALDVGFLLQHHAAVRVPRLELSHPLRSLGALLRTRRWSAGFAIGLAGWALYLLALGCAPLSLVQSVAAAGVGLLVLLAALSRRRLPSRRQLVGALIATGGLVALGLSLLGGASDRTSPVPAARVLICVVLVAVATATLVRRPSAASGGVAAGLWYGLGDVASKALLVSLPVHVAVASVLGEPYLYAALAAHGLGFVLLQRAFQRGGAVAAVAPMTAATTLLPMLAGVLVLGDALPSSPPLLALRLGAFTASALGACLLAREHEASMVEADEPVRVPLGLAPSL